MIRYSFTIFLSAFLLFQIQPLVAKLILPRFGGTSAVWTTCMMYFQVMLLFGYLYVHLIRSVLSPRAAWIVHTLLLVVSAFSIRIGQINLIQIDGESGLTWPIVTILSLTIGLSFLALSTTGPLIQAWHSLSHPTGQTYRLYALSNLGSMLALFSYPFVFERFFGLDHQQIYWQIGFFAFALLAFWSGCQTRRFTTWGTGESQATASTTLESSHIGFLQMGGWIGFSAIGSVILLSTTNLMTQEVASYPFLWILPLALYLLSLIICFDRPNWYRRTLFAPLFIVSVFSAIVLIHVGTLAGLTCSVIGMSSVCFTGTMICHGEMQRLKPSTDKLTLFFLLVATGGAIGGISVAVLAPMFLNGFYEFHCAILAALLIPLGIVLVEAPKKGLAFSPKVWGYTASSLVAATLVGCSLVFLMDSRYRPTLVFSERNEYGTVSVHDVDGYRILVNGQTDHGGQFLKGPQALEPSSYYVQGSGASIAFNAYREWQSSAGSSPPLNVGVIGLGTGSLVSWGEPQDRFRFYEINPLVHRIAEDYFTYLANSHADVVVGDGRIELERELDSGNAQNYDLLFVDAFSSDSIPLHLMTRECMELYWKHLNSDGILIMHITNRFVDMRPVVHTLARDHNLRAVLINHAFESSKKPTTWVLLTRNDQIADGAIAQNASSEWPAELKEIRWTDKFASLAPVIIWSGRIDWGAIAERQTHRRKARSSESSIGEDRPVDSTKH